MSIVCARVRRSGRASIVLRSNGCLQFGSEVGRRTDDLTKFVRIRWTDCNQFLQRVTV